MLRSKPVRSELVWLLVTAGNEVAAGAVDGRWEDHYARRIVGHFPGEGEG